MHLRTNTFYFPCFFSARLQDVVNMRCGGFALFVCLSVCVCAKGERVGPSTEGPSRPDLKRHSFIITNLPNINMRASTQSLSLSLPVTAEGEERGVTLPADKGPYAHGAMRAVCLTTQLHCRYQSTYQVYTSHFGDFHSIRGCD